MVRHWLLKRIFRPKHKILPLPVSPSNSISPSATVPKKDEAVNGGHASAESSLDDHAPTPGLEGEGKEHNGKNPEEVEEKKEEKPVALKPAPLPTVNFWQQRAKEANQLKSKPGPSPSPLSGPLMPSSSTVEGTQVDQSRSNSKVGSVKGADASAETKKKGTRAVSAGAEAERAGASQAGFAAIKGGKKINEVKSRDESK